MGKKYIITAAACIVAVIAIVAFYLFAPMAAGGETKYVFIDDDDNIDSVYTKLKPLSHSYSMTTFSTLSRQMGYDKHIRTGRYAVEPGTSALTTFRRFRNGQQSPISLTIPSVRTIDRLAEEVGKRLMLNSDSLLAALQDEAICEKYGLDTLTIQCLFIPNTYDIYWNVSVEKFLDRMNKERKAFWTEGRVSQAKDAGMTPEEVVTMASIVDEETANDEEKPMVAGMYINRLKAGMPLQADPTVKYALKNFALKRIYHDMLMVNSPFNTYRNIGLPPGPIRIPTVAGIEAVLNHIEHEYMYMCAKEDFSGTHNFAKTYAEHLQNAAKYSAALNKRGIK